MYLCKHKGKNGLNQPQLIRTKTYFKIFYNNHV